jgi:hypothetical protein
VLLQEEARRVRALVEAVVKDLETLSKGNLSRVASANDMLVNVDSPLKPIFVFNDFRFLDKRFGVEEHPRQYLDFYQAILENVVEMERLLESKSSRVSSEEMGMASTWMNP